MKNIISSMVSAVAVVALLWGAWMWGFCRFYVPPNHMAVITAKMGRPLPPGQILASKGQKGVQEDVLAEGRHFLNPFLYERQIVPVTMIPAGRVGIVTSKVGKDLPSGEFLAGPGEKGIWRQVLGPGKYRLNPVGYRVDVIGAISIPVGYAGVVTSLSGAQAPEGEFAGRGQKGVREDILQPGLYYINPREFGVNVLEIGVNQVSLLGKIGSAVITKGQIATQNVAIEELQRDVLKKQQEKRADYLQQEQAGTQSGARWSRSVSRSAPRPQKPGVQTVEQQQISGQAQADLSGATFTLNQFVEFPSRDGFEISLDMTVEFELLPKHIAWVYRSYGDLPAAVDKIIMPQILSVSRMKGSAYGARDFIVGEGREKFQNDLTAALAKTLVDRRIVVHSALIRHVSVPMQILDPIQQASVATEQDLTNRERQNTARKQAQLNTEQSLIEQRREQVAQETEKIRAETRAGQEKQVAEIQAETLRLRAEIERDIAGVQAETIKRLGRADADVVSMVEGEKADGFRLKVQAMGDPVAYNLWTLADRLNPAVSINILHAGEGTLWTDLERAGFAELGGAEALKRKPPAAK